RCVKWVSPLSISRKSEPPDFKSSVKASPSGAIKPYPRSCVEEFDPPMRAQQFAEISSSSTGSKGRRSPTHSRPKLRRGPSSIRNSSRDKSPRNPDLRLLRTAQSHDVESGPHEYPGRWRRREPLGLSRPRGTRDQSRLRGT